MMLDFKANLKTSHVKTMCFYTLFNLLIIDIDLINCCVMSRYINVLYLFGGPTCGCQPVAVQRINQGKTQETGNFVFLQLHTSSHFMNRWLSGRMADSQSREPRFESPFATVSKIAHFRSLH